MLRGNRKHQQRQAGQSLVEFALVIPLIMTLIMGALELSVAFAANIGVNRAAQGGAHMAAQAGDIAGADCLILDHIEQRVLAPTIPSQIEQVRVELTDLGGSVVRAVNIWSRSGSTQCPVADGLILTVPYTLLSATYPDSQRCNVLAGCPSMTPQRATVDSIGVSIRYRHHWITPLGGVIPMPGGSDGSGWVIEQRNIFRMEPHL